MVKSVRLPSILSVKVTIRFWLTPPPPPPPSAANAHALPFHLIIWLAEGLAALRSFNALTKVGLFNICESPEVEFQSALTLTSAPVAIPSNLVWSASVKALVSASPS